MLKPIFAGRDSNISSCLYGINRSICDRCILLLVSISHAQQILENRNIFRLNVVELQCNQVDDWLGAPPEIPVIFGAYVYIQYHLLHFIIIALSIVARELLAATSGFTVAVYLY